MGDTAAEIYAQRQAERRDRAEKRHELERRLHDDMLKGAPRYQRANQFTRQVLHMLRDFIPDACMRQAEEEVMLNAYGLDVEIAQVPPERDVEAAAALKAAEMQMMQAPVFIGKKS